MTGLSKEDAVAAIRSRRAKVGTILRQSISAGDMSREMRKELDRFMLCCDISDAELNTLSADYLNDILKNGWWSEVGRSHLRRMLAPPFAGRK